MTATYHNDIAAIEAVHLGACENAIYKALCQNGFLARRDEIAQDVFNERAFENPYGSEDDTKAARAFYGVAFRSGLTDALAAAIQKSYTAAGYAIERRDEYDLFPVYLAGLDAIGWREIGRRLAYGVPLYAISVRRIDAAGPMTAPLYYLKQDEAAEAVGRQIEGLVHTDAEYTRAMDALCDAVVAKADTVTVVVDLYAYTIEAI